MAKTQDLLALLQTEAAPAKKPHVNDEVVRKLALLNPQLKGQESTDAFLLKAQDALQQKPKPAPDQPLVATNADQLIGLSHERYERERRDLELQLATLQARLARLKGKHLDELMTALHELDPNLGSPLTQTALKQRKPYLDTVGFTVAKLIDHIKGRR